MTISDTNWRETVRALAGTCSLREAALDAGVSYRSVSVFAKAEGLEFPPPDCLSIPDPVEMEDGARLNLMASLYAAELGGKPRGPRDRRLLDLTAADAGSGDVRAALAKLAVA